MESLSPAVQKIINHTVKGSIGTQPGRVIFRDMVDLDLAIDFPEGQTGRNPEDYLIKLREPGHRFLLLILIFHLLKFFCDLFLIVQILPTLLAF